MPERRRRWIVALPFVLWAASASGISLERVASGFTTPLYAAAPPGDRSRLFVVEKATGRIEILRLHSGAVEPTPYLTVTGISGGREQGLLGLAFHPQYAANGQIFVNLTNAAGDTEIRRYQVSSDPDVADAGSAEIVIRYAQPDTNHNGGWIGFGPDGYLYVSSGDGGGGNDPDNNAQDLRSVLGKMLRLDVDTDDFPGDAQRNYGIPASNPFVGAVVEGGTARGEIWAYGLRNPWRASFDRETGDLLIADVGQSAREEVNFQSAASAGGENYGWRLREGTIQTPASGVGGPPPADNVEPIYDYMRGNGPFQGRSVTGGYVYRGPVLGARGVYFFGDFASGRLWSLRAAAGSATDLTELTLPLAPDTGSVNSISSFAEDGAGNLYVIDFDGEVFRLTGPTMGDVVPIIDLILNEP